MENKDISIGDAVVTADGKIAIITGYKPENPKYPFLYKTSASATTYKGGAENFKAKLGAIHLQSFLDAIGQPATPKVGLDIDALVPDCLKGIKIGDTISISNRGIPTKVIYQGYAPGRAKFPLSFIMNGKSYKGPLSCLVGSQAAPVAKRAEKDILIDIAEVYGSLSPENLTCDGEASRAVVNYKAARLNARLNALQRELGRNVTEEEAYAATAGGI